MAEAAKKTKIYKLATELNLSSDTIIEFLKKKGYEVKNHMSVVTEDMMHAITGHFKKEKDVAERHHKKVQEFRTTRKKEPTEKTDKKPARKEEEIAVPAKVAEVIEEHRPVVVEAKVAPAVVEAPPIPQEPKEVEVEAPAVEIVEEPSQAKAPVKKKEGVASPLEKLVARPQRGLKIKGKIEIAPPATQTQAAEVEEEKKKKKKKKKIREDVKQVKVPVEVEDEEVKARKRKKVRRAEVNEVEVEKAIRETLAGIEDPQAASRASFRKKKKEKREEEQQRLLEEIERDKTRVKVTEFVTVGELADEFASDVLEDTEDESESLKPRPPVVTIMGHVDHGKTSLLDYIRSANVVAGEAGGITQHIGAYELTLPNGRQITFLDTPGHEAFTAMRARGAKVTDIVVLVVAADDSVMPQTVEAISHAQAANVPMVVAINKTDKPESNPERIKQQLAEKGLLVEEYGGKNQSVELSARTGKNVDQLLEKILLEAEILDFKANPGRLARGVVIEAELDKGKGIIATVLVQKGSLRIGDSFICGIWSGRVRAMFDERGRRVEVAKPSQPAQVIGFDGIPQAGDDFVVLTDERQTREISLRRQQLKREQDFRQSRRITLDDISKQIKEGQVRDLPVIVKGDVDGSVEALADSLLRLSTKEVNIHVIHKGVGGISESDVLLAAASQAVIVGFHVRPNLNARRLAEHESVDIRLYNIIYDAINDVKNALEGMLAPTVSEEVTATVEVREIFKISKVGTIAGCIVKDGTIVRNNKVRLVREGVVVFDGGIASLKRFKEDVREVEQGFECGMGLENFNDVKVADIIEAYKIVETKRKLES
ncbi:MAG: translation initiation factor IF-2 [Ignavibacteriales bacterium]|nr:translation initiation factor IF-2 [Ignavibacteriales bacterium]